MHAPGNENRAGRSRDRLRPMLWLTGAGAALLLGLTAEVSANAATWFGVRGPRCPLGACLGELHCPGCGLVRATAAALQGDLDAALHFHPGGLVVALLLPATVLAQFHILRRGAEHPGSRRLRRLGHRALVAAVAGGWALRYLLLPST